MMIRLETVYNFHRVWPFQQHGVENYKLECSTVVVQLIVNQ